MAGRLACVIAAGFFVTGCGSSGGSTTAPSPTPTTTRVIQLGGNLSFGPVTLGTTATGLLTITNAGNSALTVSGVSSPCAGFYRASFTTGAIAAGQTQQSTLQFTPTAVQDCSGNISVTSDATSGTSTISVRASGTLDGVPLFSQAGIGDNVFTLPSYVTKIRIDATYPGSCQNFAVNAGSSLLVNIIIGTCSVADTRSPFTGTYVVTGGAQIRITISTGVSWRVTEVR